MILRKHHAVGLSRTSGTLPVCKAPLPFLKRLRYNVCTELRPSLAGYSHQRLAPAAAASAPAFGAPAPVPTGDKFLGFKKGFWTFIGSVAILGSIGGALAALLGWFSSTYALALPLVLPVISLLASLQREGLIAEDNKNQYTSLSNSLQHEVQALLAEAQSSIEEVRRELRSQAGSTTKLGTIEARLSSLEGSILSAGRATREASAGLALIPERVQREQQAQYNAIIAAVRAELRAALDARAAEESAVLAQLNARLAAVEGSLAGLEVAQGENIRRLSMSLNSALADAEASLQTSVRNEITRSIEPVQRLPQMLAAAMPALMASAPQQEASFSTQQAASNAAAQSAQAAAAAGVAAEVLADQLRAAMRQEVEGAVTVLLENQSRALRAIQASEQAPVRLDAEQWEALGKRLTRLEGMVEGVAQVYDSTVRSGALSSQVAGALSDTVNAVKADVASMLGSEVNGLHKALAENVGGMRGELEALAAMSQRVEDIAATLDGAVERAMSSSAVVEPVAQALAASLTASLARVGEQVGEVKATIERVEGLIVSVEEERAAAAALAPTSFSQLSDAQATPQATDPELKQQLAQLQSMLASISGSMHQLASQAQDLSDKVDSVAASSSAAVFQGSQAAADAQVAAAAATAAATRAAEAAERQQAAAAQQVAAAEQAAASQAAAEQAAQSAAAALAAADTVAAEARAAIHAQASALEATSTSSNGHSAAPISNGSQVSTPTMNTPVPEHVAPAAVPAAEAPARAPELSSAPEADAGHLASSTTSDLESASAAVTAESMQALVSPASGLRDMTGMSEQEVMGEGLRLLRLGREETRKGEDWGLADNLLQQALTAFSRAVDMAGSDTRALGNLGNALLAQGELKQAYLESLLAGPPPTSQQEQSIQTTARTTLRSEALALLTRAGEMFKRVLELEGWSSRALVNWGRAMCIRAELVDSGEVREKLYRAALDKFEAVLEEEPGMVTSRYRAALAMLGLARCRPEGSRESMLLLADASNYLRDVLADTTNPDAAALKDASAAALQTIQAMMRVSGR